MSQAGYARWLLAPQFTGRVALFCGIAAVAVPTIVRAAVNGIVTGCEFTPYLPFVFLSAILLKWWQASGIALVSTAIMGGLLLDPSSEHFLSECFISSAGMFLAGSAAMIGAAILTRHTIAHLQARGADESAGGIVFSLENDQVWASWYGSDEPVHLGSQQKVETMMTDFLAQLELGKRLNRTSD
jgi:hypothetical protein